MDKVSSQDALPPWTGGFAQSNPAFAYPDPDLSSLDMLCNMANIDLLTRQQAVLWPEFSWLSIPDEDTSPADNTSRCFQMFAPDISRIGYNDAGRVYSIICPQQGTYSPTFGTLNVEVTVTGQRGWVDEANRTLAADLTVEGKIWFGPSATENPLVTILRQALAHTGEPFPLTKEHAIRVRTSKVDDPAQAVFSLRQGQTDRFKSPDFALHPEAWDVGHIDVQIGDIISTGHEIVDDFNALVLEAFNLGAGNMLANGNVLSWNVWFNAPQVVHTEEWRDHAEKWRKSIDTDHGSPDGPGTDPVYFDGSPFHPIEARLEAEAAKVLAFLRKHL